MKILITGASGFLGRHVVAALQGTEHDLTLLSRTSREGFVTADVLDPSSLDAPFRGVDTVVHLAGLVDHHAAASARVREVHVTGTRHVIAAARKAGVGRLVHLSTSGTVAISTEPQAVANEQSPTPVELIHQWPYYRSKLHAEEVALAAADDTLQVVCLNPSLLLGPGDKDGSSTAAVRLFLDDQVPFCPRGGLSFADVRDVADTVVAAFSAGRSGERYLLGAANMTFRLFYERIARISDRPAPRWQAPKALDKVLDWFPNLGKDGFALGYETNRADLQMSAHTWYLDDTKARTELGWNPRDPLATLADTVQDLRVELARGA